mgnify:CR=1 FL=1
MLNRNYLYIIICILGTSCSKQASSPEEVLNSTVDVTINKSLNYLLKINIPAEAANETSEVVISSDRLDEVRSVSVKINGKDVEFQLKDAIDSFQYQETFERNAKSRVGKITQMEQRLAQLFLLELE